MRVWLAGGRRGVVLVPVVLVVVVPVLVLRPLVEVLMLVTLADMKPDANQHERRRARFSLCRCWLCLSFYSSPPCSSPGTASCRYQELGGESWSRS
jgi:hypothetical protein